MENAIWGIGALTSVATSMILTGVLRAFFMPVAVAMMLACAVSLAAHYWFWVEWYGAVRRNATPLWVGLHPIYALFAIHKVHEARKVRAASKDAEP